MTKITVTLVLTFLAALAAVEGGLILSCKHNDLRCLNDLTKLYLEVTKNGFDFIDIEPIEPLKLKLSEYMIPGATYNFTEIAVHGLSHSKLQNFHMDMKTQSVNFTLHTTLDIFAHLVFKRGGMEHPDTDPIVGPVEARKVLSWVKINYNYKLQKYVLFEHFVIGPETVDCKVFQPRKLQIKNKVGTRVADIPDAALCAIVKDAHKVLLHNLRQITKILPSTYIIEDIHHPSQHVN